MCVGIAKDELIGPWLGQRVKKLTGLQIQMTCIKDDVQGLKKSTRRLVFTAIYQISLKLQNRIRARGVPKVLKQA